MVGAAGLGVGPAAAQESGFSDVGGGVHAASVELLAADGVFEGTECGEGLFCPFELLLRRDMAVWMVRVLGEEASRVSSRFGDVDAGAWRAGYVERLAELGVTKGCRSDPLEFCPDDVVSRAQMASFLVRAFELAPASDPHGFSDVAGGVHEGNIAALAAAGVTRGCRSEPLEFCPGDSVSRAQMASFLQRGRAAGEEAEDEEDETDTGGGPGPVIGPTVGPTPIGPVPTVPPTTTVPTPPAAPRSVALQGGDAVLEASWSAPASDGGSPVTGYVVQWRLDAGVYGASSEATPTGSPHTISGLTNGARYWVRVAAVNDVGRGDWSEEADAVPATVPGRPEGVAVLRGDSEVELSWSAPANNGAAITGYVVQWKSGTQDYGAARQRTAAGSPFTVARLTNGTTYWFQVAAENGVGRSAWTDDVSATPATRPGVPQSLSAAGADSELEVSWSPPASDGGLLITEYVVQWKSGSESWDSTREATSADSSYTISGLTNGTEYQVRAAARNVVGQGDWSDDASGTPARLPGRPASVSAQRGNAELVLSWVAPDGGGLSISEYVVQWRSGTQSYGSSRQRTAAVSPYTLTGLTNGTAYSVQVAARTRLGQGPWSEEATAVPATVPARPGSVSAAPADSALAVSWVAPDGGGLSISEYVVQWKSSTQVYSSTRQATVAGSPHTVSGLTNGTEYRVRVVARNEVGLGAWSSDASGTPRGVPGAPEDLSVQRGDSGELAVSWSAPSSGSPVTGYEVQWKTAVQQWSSTSRQATASGSPHTISSLTNGTAYQVRVAALAAGGGRTWSLPVPGTPADAPAEPSGVTVRRGGSGELVVSWSAPANNGAAITGYVVQWKSGTQDYGTSRQATASSTTATLSGLTNGAVHQVRVAARNAAGQGGWSDDAEGTPAARPDKTADVSTQRGDARLAVSWSAPANNGAAITGYVVQWKSGAQVYGTSRQATASGTTHTLSGLTNGTAYQVRVAARNAAGQGDWSDDASGTPAAAPGTPGGVSVARGGSGELSVSWSVPANNGAAITGYVVQWKSGVQVYGTSRQGAASGTTHTLSGLTNGTAYQVRVAARNAVGLGDWSGDVPGTPAARPGAPGSLSADSAAPPEGDRELVLTWLPPSDTGGFDVVRYVVQWRSGADQFGTTNQSTTTDEPDPDTGLVTHSLTSLDNGAEYSVRVAAVTSIGQGDWSDVASATLYGRPAAPGLTLTVLWRRIRVDWTPPSDTGGLPVAGYRLQWKSGTQEFVLDEQRDLSVTSGLDADKFTRTFTFPLSADLVEYTFRVWAYTHDSDAGGDRRGHAATAGATPLSTPGLADHQALRGFMERTVEHYETESPWVRTAWDHISDEIIRLVAPESLPNSAGITEMSCTTTTDKLRNCTANLIEVNALFREEAEVMLHELAHVYVQTTGLPSDKVRDALGAAWLFFYDKHYASNRSLCPLELFADALVSLTMDTPTLPYYPSVCTSESAPPAQTTAVAQSVLDGEVSEWFTDNYCTATTAWAKVKSASGIGDAVQRMGRSMLVYNMQGLFGGYRSARIAAQAGYVAGNTETNPWNHTVCTIPDPEPPAGSPGAPSSFALASGNAQITASWAAPTDTGTSAITGYELQWRPEDDAYDQTAASTRKTTLGASALSHTVTGLGNERYAMRVRAVNTEGAGAWSDEVYSQPGVPGPVENVRVYELMDRLVVTWDPPADTGGAYLTDTTGGPDLMYQVKWEKDGSTAGICRTAEGLFERVLLIDIKRRVGGGCDEDLTHNDTMSIEIAATNVTDDTRCRRCTEVGYGESVEVSGTPLRYEFGVEVTTGNVIQKVVEDVLLPRYGATFPWLQTTWDYLKDYSRDRDITSNGINRGFSSTEDILGGIGFGCDHIPRNVPSLSSRLPACHWSRVELQTEVVDFLPVVVHELAHLYTLVPGISGDASPGLGLLYLGTTYTGSNCNYIEMYADALEYAVIPLDTSPPSSHYQVYWTQCTGSPSEPTEADSAVLASAVAGDVPGWFTDTYGTDHAKVWAAVRALSGAGRTQGDEVRVPLGKSALLGFMSGMFGGYCSASDAAWSLLASDDGTIANPWRDGGCRPGRPVDAALTADDGALDATWTAADDGGHTVTGYEIQWRSGSESYDESESSTRKASVTGLSHRITGLTNGVSHTVRIRAVNSVGVGAWSAEISRIPGTPSAPLSLALTPGNSVLDVVWQAPSDDGGSAVSYEVLWKSGSESYDETVSSTRKAAATGLSHQITGLANGTRYTVCVRAKNSTGTGVCAEKRAVAAAPRAPNSVAAVAGDTVVDVSWQAPAYNGGLPVSGYDLDWRHRGRGERWDGVDWTTVTLGDVTSYQLTGRFNGSGVQVRVRARNSGASGDWSSHVSVIVGAPSAPRNVSAVAGNGQVTVSWTPPANTGGHAITEYVVRYTAGTDFDWALGEARVAATTGTHSHTITGLTSGRTFNIMVTASNGQSFYKYDDIPFSIYWEGEGLAALTSATPS